MSAVECAAPVVSGRDRELGELRLVLASARHRRGAAVFVLGEEGMGRTALCQAAVREAEASGMLAVCGRTSRIDRGIPLRPLAEALLDLTRRADVPLEALGGYLGVLGQVIPDFGPASRAAGFSPVLLAEAVLRLLALAGRSRGCLIVLEDLHDADPTTLAVVEYLADNLAAQSVALLATVRLEPCDAVDLALAASRGAGASVMILEPLDIGQIREITAARLCAAEQQVADELARRVAALSGGNPLIAREFVDAMRSSGEAFHESTTPRNGTGQPTASWRLRSGVSTPVPDCVVRLMTRRADRLGPYGRPLMSAAAVLGGCFPAALLGAVTGLGAAPLRDAVRAGLIEPCRSASGWYETRHPALTPALLACTTDRQRALWARRAAATAADGESDLDHVGLAARLLETVLRELSRPSAIEVLGRARALRATAETLTALIPALADAGKPDDALRLSTSTWSLAPELPAELAADVALRTAWVAVLAGPGTGAQRWIKRLHELDRLDDDGSFALERELVTAWEALGSTPGQEVERAAERITAQVRRLDSPRPDRLRVEIRAALLLGRAARRGDVRAAGRWFAHAAQLAQRRGPTTDRIRALILLGEQDWLTGVASDHLEQAGDEARRAGAPTLARAARSSMLLRAALQEHGTDGEEDTDATGVAAAAIAAGLRADRAGLERILISLDHLNHDGEDEDRSAALVLARAVGAALCALLEEKPELALRETAFAASARRHRRQSLPLAEPAGLDLLLRVLHAGAGRPEYREALAQSAREVCWNEQFTHLADAVLFGRAGRRQQASAAMADAERIGGLYPTAHHLGLRLVADAAIADGWGEPALWLCRAEEHFHALPAPAVADACRARLRRLGVRIPQRRRDTERVPAALRALGVTVREYEVLRLLAGGPGNRRIAGALHISPRTVEKHVASLLAKTARADRCALASFAEAWSDRPPQRAEA